MTGPVRKADVGAGPQGPAIPTAGLDLMASHVTDVAGLPVRRALPQRGRRTIGAWCFLDHMGPITLSETAALRVGPHPHLGLQTVTWLVSGEVLHRDSLGSEQVIRPGQLNLMTAGAGVAHAEASTGAPGSAVQGVQLWVAQPESTRHGPAAFEHHADLPRVELAGGMGTVLVGSFGLATSPARRDTDHVGVDLELDQGSSVLPLDPESEYGIVVLEGDLRVGDRVVEPGHLAYVGLGRDELALAATGPTRALLIGGVPFPEPLLMWWNFVARTREEITEAYRHWQADDDRFGSVASHLARILATPPLWLHAPPPS